MYRTFALVVVIVHARRNRQAGSNTGPGAGCAESGQDLGEEV